MKLIKLLLLLVIISIFAVSVLYAQVSGTGSIVVLVASTPTPTPPPPPPPPGAGCPVGFTCATPITAPAWNGGTMQYGAGLQPQMPTLINSHTYTCTTGDNTSGLQTAVNQAGDVLISANSATPCTISGTVNVPANKQIQCQSINTTLLQTTTAAVGPSMLFWNGVSGGGISNCTLQGQNGTAPPGNFACTPHFGPGSCDTLHGPGTTTSFLIHGDRWSNGLVTANVFKQTIAQCAFEDYCGGSGPSGCTGMVTSYNSFFNSTLYGVCYDNAANSDVLHNYSLNGIIGHEMDNCQNNPTPCTTQQTESGLTEFNYSVRNQFGTGTDVAEGQVGYFEGLFGATGGLGNGVIVQFNTVDGMAGSNFRTFIGAANGTNNSKGQFSNNACINGCSVGP